MTTGPAPPRVTPSMATLRQRRPGAAPRMSSAYERYLKPLLDRLIALLVLVLAAPILAATSLAVLVSLGRPVLYRQTRVGLHGRPFMMLKFRTMKPDRRQARQPYSGPERRFTHKTLADPRHTTVGRFLREFSLDELPQLWNVLRGDLSLVGPRPELSLIVEHYEPWQHERHAVKPGLTGLWQITERGNGLMHEHTEVDLRYLRTLSLGTDLKILLLTLPAILGMRRGS